MPQLSFSWGVQYETGDGVSKDLSQARTWYRKSAEQGHALSQFNLGSMYWAGRGVEIDHVRAYAWFDLAALHGYDEATEARNNVGELMTSTEIAKALTLTQDLKASIDNRQELLEERLQ